MEYNILWVDLEGNKGFLHQAAACSDSLINDITWPLSGEEEAGIAAGTTEC